LGSVETRVLTPQELPQNTIAQVNITGIQLLKQIDFWLYFVSFSIMTGCGTIVTNNLGSLLTSLQVPDGNQTIYITLLSVSNFSGTVLFGITSDWMASVFQRKISVLQAINSPSRFAPAFLLARTAIFFYMNLVMMIAMCFFIPSTPTLLFPGVLLVGLSLGGLWSSVAAIMIEFFGPKHFGKNFTILEVAPSVSSLVLGTGLAGGIYQHYAKGSNDCYGVECFQYTWVGCLGLGGISTGLAFALWMREVRKKLNKRD
jgi:MFS family permease